MSPSHLHSHSAAQPPRLGHDGKKWFDFLSIKTHEIKAPVLADELRSLAQKFPRLVCLEKSASPGVYFLASLTADGRIARAPARAAYNATTATQEEPQP